MTRARASIRSAAVLSVLVLAPALAASAARADDAPLSDREAAAAAASERENRPGGWCTLDPDLLKFEGDGYKFRLGGYATADVTARGRHFEEDGRYRTSVGDARPVIEAWSETFTFHVEGDALGVDTPRNLYEAWASWQALPAMRVTMGQFRVALGSEFATHEGDLPFIGYGFTSYLDGRYDTGGRIDGSPVEGLWYQAALVGGHGFNLEGDRLTGPQGSLRAVVAPFRLGDNDAAESSGLHGFYVGAAYAYRTDSDDPIVVTTPLQSPVIVTPDLGGDSGQWIHLDVGWSMGPFQVGVERVFGTIDGVDVPGGETDLDDLGAYTWFVAWNLTGEGRGWRDGTWSSEARSDGGRDRMFPPAGRWELAGRFSNVNVHRELFNEGIVTRGGGGTAGSHGSTWQAMTYSLALFWEVSDNLRFGVEGLKTVTEDRMAIFGGTKRDTSFVLRAELRF